MKRPLPSFTLLLGIATMALSLDSCTAVKQPRQEIFDEKAFTWTRQPGSGAVDGKLFIEMRNGSINVGSDTEVVLFPVNAYTTEIMNRKYEHGTSLQPADPRMSRYLHVTTADSEGRFSFRGLAPGEYYVGSSVSYTSTITTADSAGILVESHSPHVQFIYKQISVRNGQVNHITDWRQAADWNMQFH